jgi:hypothetical protein
MNSAHILIQSNGLSDKQVKLGRLVTNIWTPFDSFHDSPSLVEPKAEATQIDDHNSTFCFNRNCDESIWLKLSKLFGIDLNRKSTTALVIKAKSVSTRTLSDYTSAFNSIFDSAAESETDTAGKTRKWIQNRVEGKEAVYMVVGIQTVTDAKVTQVRSSNINTSLHSGIAVPEITSQGVSSVAEWSAPDVSIAIAIGRDGGASSAYEIQGTRVIAVQYCKVKSRTWPLAGDGGVELTSRTQWKWYMDEMRAGGTSNGGQSCFGLEVSLEKMVDAAMARNVSEGDGEDDGEDEDCVDNISVDGIEIVF